MDDEIGYSLRLPFDTDDPEFTRGVEVGIVYQQLRLIDALDVAGVTGGYLEVTMHATNAEMAIRMGEAFDPPFHVAADETNVDEWLAVSFRRGEI